MAISLVPPYSPLHWVILFLWSDCTIGATAQKKVVLSKFMSFHVLLLFFSFLKDPNRNMTHIDFFLGD